MRRTRLTWVLVRGSAGVLGPGRARSYIGHPERLQAHLDGDEDQYQGEDPTEGQPRDPLGALGAQVGPERDPERDRGGGEGRT